MNLTRKSALLSLSMLCALTLCAPKLSALTPATASPATPAAVTSNAPVSALHFTQANSLLEFEGSYDGEAITGKFERFAGNLQLGNTSALAKLDVQIDIASLNSEYTERDDMLKSAEWFDTAKFAQGQYTSTGPCTLKSAAAVVCAGTLTLRKISKPTPITLSLAADQKSMTGSALLNRRDFGIGSGEWDQSGIIGESVKIRFTVRFAAK